MYKITMGLVALALQACAATSVPGKELDASASAPPTAARPGADQDAQGQAGRATPSAQLPPAPASPAPPGSGGGMVASTAAAGAAADDPTSPQPSVQRLCGNGIIDPGEVCDGNCPSSCDDGDVCTRDELAGVAADCNAACSHVPLASLPLPDGCCPPGSTAATDGDCKAVCGNGVLEAGETCDGNCPSSCDDGNPCTADTQSGEPDACTAVCTHLPITMARPGDQCCPSGANANTDPDCKPVCGNRVREPGEACDGDCSPSCDDGNACTTDDSTGSAIQCDLRCTHRQITSPHRGDGCCPAGTDANADSDCAPICGNGVVEAGEKCDGNCPDSIACDDHDPCTTDLGKGDPALCNVECVHPALTPSAGRDGCCPAGANANNDGDCQSVCGNGVKEPGEQCDGNDCPTGVYVCDDGDPCTTDERVRGSRDDCTAHCAPERETSACMMVPSGWALGTTVPAGRTCPSRFMAGINLTDRDGKTVDIWCDGQEILQCKAGDTCVYDPGARPPLCIISSGDGPCPAGLSRVSYSSVTVCCD